MSVQGSPCFLHVHVFVLQSFLQLQRTTSSISGGAAGWSVIIGINLPSKTCHPQSCGFHTFTSPFPLHHLVKDPKTMELCSCWRWRERLRFHWRWVLSYFSTESPVFNGGWGGGGVLSSKCRPPMGVLCWGRVVDSRGGGVSQYILFRSTFHATQGHFTDSICKLGLQGKM